jgi:glycosyltransferase involved in cell wall biosynthesis
MTAARTSIMDSMAVSPRAAGAPLTVLLCHNYYQHRGGEDESFEAEAALLESRGHRVVRFVLHNDAVDRMQRVEAAGRTFWNPASYRDLRRLIRHHRPGVVHCTNTFPLISPAVYYAARVERVPVVQALRNYRLICPGGLLLRDDRPCQDCVQRKLAWPAVLHACYRESRPASTVVSAMVAVHRALGTWRKGVTLYFTPSRFARRMFLEAGFPPDSVAVKPNFVGPDPGPGPGGPFALYAGRLSNEKGVSQLLAAWHALPDPVPLKIIGEGPLLPEVRQAMQRDPRIGYLGQLPLQEVLRVMGEAACVMVPSLWYETFGRTIIEAYAKGTPVIATRTGAFEELVQPGRTGLLAEPGAVADLVACVQWFLRHPAEVARMRREARQEYERHYTPGCNYEMLSDLYARAIGMAAGGHEPSDDRGHSRKKSDRSRLAARGTVGR